MALFGKKDEKETTAENKTTEKAEKKGIMSFFGGPTGHNDFAKKEEKPEAKPAAKPAVKPAAATTVKPAATTTVKPAATTVKPAATIKPAATTTVKPAATTTVKPSLESAPAAPLKSVEELAKEVIQGKWGNGADRKAALEKAGYDYNAVQAKVNAQLSGSAPAAPAAPALKSIEEVAKEVIQGKWGNGADRKAALEKAGYDYNTVQAKVNALLK